MKFILLSILLFFGLAAQGQNYTITVDTNTCRISFTSGQLNYHFLAEKSRYITRNGNTILFDDRRSIGTNINRITNYATNAELRADVDSWFETCNVVSAPVVPPGLTPLFANQKSIDLDGTAEYVSVPDADNLSMTTGAADIPFTVSAWVYIEADQTGIIIGKDSANVEYGFFYGATNDDIRFIVYTPNGANFQGRETDAVSLNQWYHVAATYDGSGGTSAADGIDIYINGVLSDVASVTGGFYNFMSNSISPVSVGARTDPSAYFAGKIDQACIFRNVELTLPEIKELMTIRDVTQYTYYDSLVLYQEYDSPDSTQANGIVDLSPAGNHGTMQSGEYTDLNVCVEWPYSYQLESNTTYSNLTPMQSSIESDSSYGGFGIEYGGTTEYTSIANNALLNFTHTDSFTLSYWINTEHDGASTDYVFSKITAGIKGYGMRYGASKDPNFLVAEDGANNVTFVADSDPISNNRWIHQVVVYENGEARIYENGDSLEVTKTPTGTVTDITNTEIAAIGKYSGFSSDYWQGTVGDLMILDRAISTQEVKAIYNQHAPRNETNESLAGNIVGYWRGYNSTNVASGVLDQSGNNLHGTPTNTLDNAFQYTTPRQIFDADTAGSVDFDGLAEYISIADSDSLTMLTLDETSDTSFSISAWVNMNAWNYPIANKYTSSGNLREYYFTINSSGQLNGFIYDQSASASIQNTSTATAALDQWHHVAMTYNGNGLGTSIRLYLNGESVETTPASSGSYVAMENKSSTFNIALRNSTYGNGKTSNVTIIKGIRLKPCQVQEIYNDGSPVDPRSWTFWSDDFIHYKLNQDEDLETTEGVTNISTNGSCNGTAQSMTNAANKITTSFPTN